MKYIGLYATPTGQYVSEDNFFQTYFYNIRSVALGAFSTFVRDAYRQFANKRPLYEEETVTQYEDRVIREFKAKPTLRQRAGATYDAAALAATPQKVSGMFTEEEEERGR